LGESDLVVVPGDAGVFGADDGGVAVKPEDGGAHDPWAALAAAVVAEERTGPAVPEMKDEGQSSCWVGFEARVEHSAHSLAGGTDDVHAG
jgi:hypothetical protein